MNRIATLGFALVLSSGVMAATGVHVKTPADKLSYSIGNEIGRNLSAQGVKIDPNLFMRGVNDAISNKNPLMTPKDMQATLNTFQQKLIKERTEKIKVMAAKNEQESAAFLTANGKKDGVKTTGSGLQYQIVQEGTGPHPKATDSVTVNYRGQLIDGTEFDSSYARNQPATFGVSQVIKGWSEALQMMHPGAKWKLFIPAELAYGKFGAGPKIGPNQALIFEVELLSINPRNTTTKSSS